MHSHRQAASPWHSSGTSAATEAWRVCVCLCVCLRERRWSLKQRGTCGFANARGSPHLAKLARWARPPARHAFRRRRPPPDWPSSPTVHPYLLSLSLPLSISLCLSVAALLPLRRHQGETSQLTRLASELPRPQTEATGPSGSNFISRKRTSLILVVRQRPTAALLGCSLNEFNEAARNPAPPRPWATDCYRSATYLNLASAAA